MLIKSADVIGLKVLTLNDGKYITTVKDVIYDPKINKVIALLIDEGGWFHDAKVILYSDIRSVGEDAVTIASEDVIRKAGDVQERVANIASDDKYLTKTKVITESGTELGNITDIFFEASTGDVAEFEVTQGAIKDIQTGRKKFRIGDIVTIGEDATIVTDSTAASFERQAKVSGVEGAVNQGAAQAKAALSDAALKASSAANDAKVKLQDAAETAKDKATDLRDQADAKLNDPEFQQKLQNAQAKVSEVATEAGNKVKEGVDRMQNKAEEVKNDPNVQNTADDAKLMAKGVQKKVGDKANEAKSEAQKATEGPRQKAKQWGEDLKSAGEDQEHIESTANNSPNNSRTY